MRRGSWTGFLGLWALALAACGEDSQDAGQEAPPEERACPTPEQEPACEVGALRCEGAQVQRCAQGSDACRFWDALHTCAGACAEGSCEPLPVCESSAEVCDGQDNDCDGAVDEAGVCDAPCEGECEAGQTRCDGINLVVCVEQGGCGAWSAPRGCGAGLVCEQGACVEAPKCADYDGDGFGVGVDCAEQDCQDRDPLVYPGAPEECNGLDDDCDGVRDEDAGCPPCAEGSCEPGSVVCQGRSVAACVRGPDGCGLLDVLERCDVGEVCAAGACVEFACDEDGLEDNDDAAQATALLEGEGAQLASLCAGDEDWFELPAELAGGWLEVVLTPEDGASDLDLWLFEGQQELGRAATLAPIERVGAFVPQDAGRLLVRVVGYEDASSAYRLAWRAPRLDACVGDGWEDNNASASASALPEGEPAEATLCRGDVDWYYPEPLAPGETWSVRAQVDRFFGEVELTLLDALTREVLATTEREGGPRVGYTHSAAAREARPVFLQVRPAQAGQFGAYVLDAQRWGEEACQPDAYDASVTQALAAPVPWRQVEGGRVAQLQAWVCYGEELWFDLGELEFDAKVGADAERGVGGVDPELELVDADGGVLAQGARLGARESLRVEVPAAQRGWLRVRGFGGDPGEVNLSVSVQDPVPCEADALEPNDEPGGGTALAAGERREASLCDGDEDWFELGRLMRRPGLTVLDLVLEHGEVRGAVEALLFRGTRAVARSASEGGGERLRYELTGPEDTYSLLVRARGGASLRYALGFNADAAPSCVEDGFEPNDGVDTVAQVQVNASVEGSLCGGEDWFVLEAPSEPGQVLRAALALEPGAGNLDLDLLVDGELVASSLNLTGDEVLEAQTGLGAVYHVVVYSPGEDQGAYRLSVELVEQ